MAPKTKKPAKKAGKKKAASSKKPLENKDEKTEGKGGRTLPNKEYILPIILKCYHDGMNLFSTQQILRSYDVHISYTTLQRYRVEILKELAESLEAQGMDPQTYLKDKLVFLQRLRKKASDLIAEGIPGSTGLVKVMGEIFEKEEETLRRLGMELKAPETDGLGALVEIKVSGRNVGKTVRIDENGNIREIEQNDDTTA